MFQFLANGSAEVAWLSGRNGRANDGKRNPLRIRHGHRFGGGMDRLLWRRRLALRHPARHLRQRGGRRACSACSRSTDLAHQLLHPRPFDRDVPGSGQADRRRRPRDRRARLSAREPGRDDADAGRGGPGQIHRPDREAVRAQAARLRRALVGDVAVDRRPAAEIRLHLRPQPGLSRFPAVLCPGRRRVER